MLVKFTGLNEAELRKLEAAMKEDAFVEKMNATTTANEVKAVLDAEGINFSMEEIEIIRTTLAKAMSENGEISENDLEDVAGGGTFTLVEISWKTKKGVTWKVNIPW